MGSVLSRKQNNHVSPGRSFDALFCNQKHFPRHLFLALCRHNVPTNVKHEIKNWISQWNECPRASVGSYITFDTIFLEFRALVEREFRHRNNHRNGFVNDRIHCLTNYQINKSFVKTNRSTINHQRNPKPLLIGETRGLVLVKRSSRSVQIVSHSNIVYRSFLFAVSAWTELRTSKSRRSSFPYSFSMQHIQAIILFWFDWFNNGVESKAQNKESHRNSENKMDECAQNAKIKINLGLAATRGNSFCWRR